MDKMPKDKMPGYSERTHILWNFVWFAFVRVYLLFAFCLFLPLIPSLAFRVGILSDFLMGILSSKNFEAKE